MIVSAYPKTDNLGTNDGSNRAIPAPTLPIPQFLPKIYIMKNKGSTVPELCDTAKAISLYGDDIFDTNSPFYKHSNRMLYSTLSNNAIAMVHRLVDPNVKEKSNITFYLDILEDDIDVYKRHDDGSVLYDEDGEPVVDDDNSPFKGYRVKWIAEYDDGTSDYGTKTLKEGTMEDSDGNKSTMYPIVEYRDADVGTYGNDLGFCFDAVDYTNLSSEDLAKYKVFPLKMSFYRKDNPTKTPTLMKNIYNGPDVTFSLNPKAVDPLTNSFLTIERIVDEYYFETDYKEIVKPYFYAENAAAVLEKLYAKEAEWRGKTVTTAEGNDVLVDTWYDFLSDLTDEEQKYMLNPVTFRTLKRVPYFGFVHDTDAAELSGTEVDVTMSKSLPTFMNGGVDGDISDDMFESLVQTEMEKYLDLNGPYMDSAINVESILLDSGFKLDTKKKMVNFITVRKDTFLMLSTYIYNKDNKPMTLEEDRAVGMALNARCQLAPESQYYGTPVMRAMIVGGSGEYLADINKPRLPLTIDIAEKSCSFMGASSGKWNKTKLFDRGELNTIDSMAKIEPSFIPEGVKPGLWDVNIVYPQSFDRETYFFPALQTVYPDDTSVLNSYFTVMAIVYIYKVAYEAQRRYTGSTALEDNEFLAKVDAFIMSKLKDAFADMFIVKSISTLTDMDKLRGYSWTTHVEIYASNMKTVMSLTVDAYRKS